MEVNTDAAERNAINNSPTIRTSVDVEIGIAVLLQNSLIEELTSKIRISSCGN